MHPPPATGAGKPPPRGLLLRRHRRGRRWGALKDALWPLADQCADPFADGRSDLPSPRLPQAGRGSVGLGFAEAGCFLPGWKSLLVTGCARELCQVPGGNLNPPKRAVAAQHGQIWVFPLDLLSSRSAKVM